MAKKKTPSNPVDPNPLPGMDQSREPEVQVSDPQTSEPAPEPEPVPVPKPKLSTMQVSVPFLDTQGYARRRVDVQLSAGQAQKLKGIQTGLEAKEAKLADGRNVCNPMHAMVWMIENAE